MKVNFGKVSSASSPPSDICSTVGHLPDCSKKLSENNCPTLNNIFSIDRVKKTRQPKNVGQLSV